MKPLGDFVQFIEPGTIFEMGRLTARPNLRHSSSTRTVVDTHLNVAKDVSVLRKDGRG